LTYEAPSVSLSSGDRPSAVPFHDEEFPMRKLWLLMLVVPLAARAQVRLGQDAPARFSLTAAEAPAQQVSASTERGASWAVQFGAGFAAGLVGTPASLSLAQWVGSGPRGLITTAIPALLIMGLLPPLLTTLACWATGNWQAPGRHRFWPSFGVNVLINGLTLMVAGFLGASVGEFGSMAFLGMIDGGLMSGAATLLMRLTAKEPVGTVLTSRDPRVSDTWFIASSQVAF
jgi:hypothetical protein